MDFFIAERILWCFLKCGSNIYMSWILLCLFCWLKRKWKLMAPFTDVGVIYRSWILLIKEKMNIDGSIHKWQMNSIDSRVDNFNFILSYSQALKVLSIVKLLDPRTMITTVMLKLTPRLLKYSTFRSFCFVQGLVGN